FLADYEKSAGDLNVPRALRALKGLTAVEGELRGKNPETANIVRKVYNERQNKIGQILMNETIKGNARQVEIFMDEVTSRRPPVLHDWQKRNKIWPAVRRMINGHLMDVAGKTAMRVPALTDHAVRLGAALCV
ncbi:MAG TPA: hypothetical protein PKW15_08515, partial [Alphaproteobacteria bacterium]|nr:hypothetical protein [Alphaproteobacteria bacterium]